VALTAAQADYLLEEWARWQRCDPLTMDWSHSTAFGKCIKPDPVPAREPVDEDRALRTDRVIAKLPGRLRFLVKLHYLDSVPIDVKARRMRIAREGYKRLLEGAQRVVGERLDQPPSRRHSVPR
jgi:DNA-directed RNA polymerase specialized sigma24 family protein